jgi:hypothetical protein
MSKQNKNEKNEKMNFIIFATLLMTMPPTSFISFCFVEKTLDSLHVNIGNIFVPFRFVRLILEFQNLFSYLFLSVNLLAFTQARSLVWRPKKTFSLFFQKLSNSGVQKK